MLSWPPKWPLSFGQRQAFTGILTPKLVLCHTLSGWAQHLSVMPLIGCSLPEGLPTGSAWFSLGLGGATSLSVAGAPSDSSSVWKPLLCLLAGPGPFPDFAPRHFLVLLGHVAMRNMTYLPLLYFFFLCRYQFEQFTLLWFPLSLHLQVTIEPLFHLSFWLMIAFSPPFKKIPLLRHNW